MKTNYRSETPEDTDCFQKPGYKSKDSPGKDLDLLKTVKVSLLGNGNQHNLFKNKRGVSPPGVTDMGPNKNETEPNPNKNMTSAEEGETVRSFEPAAVVNISEDRLKPQKVEKNQITSAPRLSKIEHPTNPPINEEQQYTDMSEDYDDCNGDGDDDDDNVSLVISDNCAPYGTQDESHYITTHEIQLAEVSDHEGDCELGLSSSGWEIEDDNRAFTFVDYACFDGDEATVAGRGARGSRSNSGAAVSTLQESDPCDTAKSSDESLSKTQSTTGQIHLSIKTTSRAISDPSNIQENENILYHARRSGDMSCYVLRGADGKADKFCDRTKCFIAAPGRVHFGSKTKGKGLNGHSSSESSAVSELDDADKEVRNLTARTFKSLAYPYFNAINFSTSSESSASERGLGINRWSTFVDLKYGNVGLEKSRMSHKNATSSFEIAKGVDNKGYNSMALASIKEPSSNIFTLNSNPHSASSSTKKIELMGKFSQGVITLRETLNFSCNLQSRVTGEERRLKFAHNAAGSRSTDEVTSTLPSSQRRAVSQLPCNAGDAMDVTHKKAVFASSLIKNVISKKMQFEQERKMERGEISEPHHAPSPCFAHRDGDPRKERPPRENRELQRQESKFSEASSDMTIVCLDDLGDIVDSGSCDTKSDSRRPETLTHARETNLESTNEAGIDTKKGAFEACKSTLLHSQNSAFRSWRDGELEFQKEHKNDKTPECNVAASKDNPAQGDLYFDSGNSTLNKMSHLFVPSIQLLSNDGDLHFSVSAPADHAVGEIVESRTNNTLYVPDSSGVMTSKSKSPEIQINLRSFKDNKQEQYGAALRPPNLGYNAASLTRTDDFRCQALAAALKGESSDKVPQFMVRDIRDNKGKLQTPIHQVRDVRKLVKSSYHFVSLDNNDNKSCYATSDPYAEQKKQVSHRNPISVSPIVITCQSVNTNGNGKQSENVIDTLNRGLNDDPIEIVRSSPEGAKGDSALLQRRGAFATSNKDSNEGGMGLRTEVMTTTSRWQEKIADATDKRADSKMANQGALERLQAAVKTMEQLYVFDRNEWKRKSEPRPLTDSHVLSMISREEERAPEEEDEEEEGGRRWSNTLSSSSADKHLGRAYPNTASPDAVLRRDDKDTSSPMGSKKAHAKASQAHSAAHRTAGGGRGSVPRSPKDTRSAHSQTRQQQQRRALAEGYVAEAESSEHYLAIPAKCHANSSSRQAAQADRSFYVSAAAARARSQPGSPQQATTATAGPRARESSPSAKCNVAMETRSPEIPAATAATVYHTLPVAMAAGQPQVYCFSPAVTPGPTLEHFQPVQRKMLLDPSTGSYYLVDTPVQPATRRLFDPETGQYVDVPMPQAPVTPLPMQMPISPLALSPGGYGHTYMIYPGFMAATPQVVPARTLAQSQVTVQSDAESGEKVSAQRAEGFYMESPYYMATGKGLPAGPHYLPTGRGPQQGPGGGLGGGNRPVISITSQQGPRIIAPPSFDGTTMSFVVEHR